MQWRGLERAKASQRFECGRPRAVDSTKKGQAAVKTQKRYTNLCRTCGEDFGSVTAFDAHRVGNHGYLYSEDQPKGRRCLSVDEIEAFEAFARNSYGRWSLAGHLEAARKVADATPQRPRGVSEAA